jgi:nucleoside permease NupC
MIDKLTQEERDNALEQNVIDTIAKTKSEIRVARTVALIALIGLVFLLNNVLKIVIGG